MRPWPCDEGLLSGVGITSVTGPTCQRVRLAGGAGLKVVLDDVKNTVSAAKKNEVSGADAARGTTGLDWRSNLCEGRIRL